MAEIVRVISVAMCMAIVEKHLGYDARCDVAQRMGVSGRDHSDYALMYTDYVVDVQMVFDVLEKWKDAVVEGMNDDSESESKAEDLKFDVFNCKANIYCDAKRIITAGGVL